MPLHRHECEVCGHRFRVLVLPGTPDEEPACPNCGSRSTRRKLPLVAVQFKGSGYYRTDHGRKGSQRSDKGNSETDSGDSSSAETSSDAGSSKGSKDQSESKDSAASSKTSKPE